MNQERPHFIKDSENLVLLGYGKRSHTYATSEHVIKIVREVDELHEAQSVSKRLQEQYKLLVDHLGSYVLDTQFVIGSTSDRDIGIFIVQPRIEGVFLGEAVSRAITDRKGLGKVISFLRSVVEMYSNTGHIADLAGRTSSQFYDPLLSRNVLVDTNDNPLLVDTNFSRSSERFGFIHNRLVARGVIKTIRSLEERETHL